MTSPTCAIYACADGELRSDQVQTARLALTALFYRDMCIGISVWSTYQEGGQDVTARDMLYNARPRLPMNLYFWSPPIKWGHGLVV